MSLNYFAFGSNMNKQRMIVSDLVQEDLESFLYTCRISNIPNAIWVDGIIIILLFAENSEKNTERLFNGLRLYERVIFVKYPKYSKTIKWNGGSYELALRNYKNFPRFVELANWIKTQPVWNESREISK